MRTRRLLLPIAILSAGLVACAEVDPVAAPDGAPGTADFTRLVAIGNSLAAGYQDGGLVEAHQRFSYAAMVARSMGKRVLSNSTEAPAAVPGEFVLPGYGAPGTAGLLRLVSLLPPTIEPLPPELAGSPVNLPYPAPYNNLGVPGARTADILNTLTSPANPFFDLVLRGQGTVLQQALAQHPTFVLLWAGNNDVLGAVTAGDPIYLTPAADFARDYRALVEALLGGEDAEPPVNPGIVAANVPDVTALPFVTTVPPFVVNPLTGARTPLLGPDGPLALPSGSSAGDYVLLPGASLIRLGYGFPLGADLNGDGQPDGKGPLPGSVVLNIQETAIIQDRAQTVNRFIGEICAQHGIAVVDVRTLYNGIRDHGLEIGGIDYDESFILGGLMGLDGIHPTDVGHAVLANAFIRAINETYGASLPLVDLADVMGISFGAEPVDKGTIGPGAYGDLTGAPFLRILTGR